MSAVAGRPAALLLALSLVACSGEDAQPGAGPVWFEELGPASGVDFEHVAFDPERRLWLPEIMGSGLALFDHDGDGNLDLYAVQCGDLEAAAAERPGNRLFAGDGSGRFTDVTEAAGVGDRGYGMGCATGDYDGDGDVDLFVTNLGADVLYQNQGDGTFRDVTAEAGVAGEGWSTSAAFLDHDADGDLDLFVVRYIHWSPESERPCHSAWGERIYCSPKNYSAPAPDVLYENRGDGVFVDASARAGLSSSVGNGLGVAWGDVTEDGIVDIYVANDGTPNHLWRGVRDPVTGLPTGRFEDAALISGCAVSGGGVAEAGMGVTLVDTDQDGDLDLFLTHLENETNTWYSGADGRFTDLTPRAGLARASLPFTGFGTGFCDFDHDGHLDLLVVNGRVTARAAAAGESGARRYAEPDSLLRGLGDGRYEPLETSGALARWESFVSRAAAFGDIDGDGDVDVCISTNGGPLRVLANVAASGQAVTLDLRGRSGAPASGALVQLETAEGSIYRHAQSAYGYLTANDPRVHVGLGAALEHESIERILVTWSDGSTEVFDPLFLDGSATLRHTQGEPLTR